MLTCAKAGLSANTEADGPWKEVSGRADLLPEDMQGGFLMIAHAARENLPCPGDMTIARVYGSSPCTTRVGLHRRTGTSGLSTRRHGPKNSDTGRTSLDDSPKRSRRRRGGQRKLRALEKRSIPRGTNAKSYGLCSQSMANCLTQPLHNCSLRKCTPLPSTDKLCVTCLSVGREVSASLRLGKLYPCFAKRVLFSAVNAGPVHAFLTSGISDSI
jgi:hypothetical protein